MGLDQWLCKRPTITEEDEMIYWRKCNQIHGWFDRKVGGIENCEEYDVTYNDLKELQDTCKKVLDNHELAEELLPVMRGAFFGCYEYNDNYFEDLKYTIEQLDTFLTNNDDEFYYHAWW